METPLNTNGNKVNKFVYEKFQSNELTNDDLVQLLILIFSLLGLKSISNYAKTYNKTYRGVEKFNKNIVKIDEFKFVIDND